MKNCCNATAHLLFKISGTGVQEGIPSIIYIGALLAIGVVGNIHVLILFSRRYIKSSTYTIFVITLSIIDLCTCIVYMPMDLYDLFNPFTFYNEVWCKTVRFSYAFFLTASVFILVLIAVERYRRICNPLKSQMAVSLSRWLCVVSVTIAFLVNIPMFILTGNHLVKIENNGSYFTGYACFIDDKYYNTMVLYAYLGLIIVLIFISAFVLIVTYVSISRVIFNRNTNIRNQTPRRKIGETVIASISTVDIVLQSSPNTFKTNHYKHMNGQARFYSTSTLKITRRLLFITGIFVAVSIPFVGLNIAVSCDIEFKEKLTNFQLTIYHIGMRLIFINNMSNPFVYGFTDRRFKNGIKELYTCRT